MIKQKVLITKICPKCEGRGYAYYPKINKKWSLTCKKCRGIGKIRVSTFIFEAIKTEKQRLTMVTDEEKRLDARERVSKFKEKNPERWKEIQNKYRRGSPKFKEYFRNYLRLYRARKRLQNKKMVLMPSGRPLEKKSQKTCVECGDFPPKPWARGLCVMCLAKQRKELLLQGKKITNLEIVKLREERKIPFSEIGRMLDVSRQRAQQIYAETKLTLDK